MPRIFKVLLIGFILGVEFIFVVTYNLYPHGEVASVRYRSKERIAALMDYHLHPSPVTESKFHEELRLMHKHEDWKGYAALGLLVALNIGGIYLLLEHNQKRQPKRTPYGIV